jgi:membrane protein DedA with SNARE-associated domain
MLQSIVDWLVGVIGKLGYTGIVALMALESSFFPFPSEVVVPPGGILAQNGEMSLLIVIISGIAGSIIGALFNYWLAVKLGRPFFLRYGKYLLVSEKKFHKSEEFFRRHGEIGTFVGRLIPGVRQIISFPAGLARMNLGRFCLFTAIGSGIWVTILAFIGYWVGGDVDVWKDWTKKVMIYLGPALVLIVAGYLLWHFKIRKPREAAADTDGEA